MTDGAPYIFISHSSKDGEFTDKLSTQLRKAGFEVWVDLDSIPDGSTWTREIERGVTDCGALVVVMSKNARESEWVESEIMLALQLKKPVLVALVDDTLLPIYLINRQFTDCRQDHDQGIREISAALRKIPLGAPPEPKSNDQAKLATKPNEHNFFKYVEQLPNGKVCAGAARDLFAWAEQNADAVTFSGKANPAFHAHVWVGPGGVAVFSVRAYSREPAVEVPLQYIRAFAPYDQTPLRLATVEMLNRLMPAEQKFTEERSNLRPNLPLAALAVPKSGTLFKRIMSEMIGRLREGNKIS